MYKEIIYMDVNKNRLKEEGKEGLRRKKKVLRRPPAYAIMFHENYSRKQEILQKTRKIFCIKLNAKSAKDHPGKM